MGIFNTLRAALSRRMPVDPELDYLNGATSRVDLEMRQREIDRGRYRRLPRLG